MFTGCRREHHPEAKTSQKITDKFAECRQNNPMKSNQNRDGFSEYKNFERELISGCRTQIYCWTYYNISMCEWKSGNLTYKTGFSFTKWKSRLQNRILNYKKRFLDYKRDSRLAIYPASGKLGVESCESVEKVWNYWKYLGKERCMWYIKNNG